MQLSTQELRDLQHAQLPADQRFLHALELAQHPPVGVDGRQVAVHVAVLQSGEPLHLLHEQEGDSGGRSSARVSVRHAKPRETRCSAGYRQAHSPGVSSSADKSHLHVKSASRLHPSAPGHAWDSTTIIAMYLPRPLEFALRAPRGSRSTPKANASQVVVVQRGGRWPQLAVREPSQIHGAPYVSSSRSATALQ